MGKPKKAEQPAEILHDLGAVRVPISELVPDPRNANFHPDENRDAIRASLREEGQVEPLLAQKSTKILIGGNGRREEMLALGWTEAWVVWLDVDDAVARRLSVRLNQTPRLARWDLAKLQLSIREITEAKLDVSGLGIDREALADLAIRFGNETERALAMAQANIAPGGAPGEFAKADPATITTEHQCPKCGFRWSGGKGAVASGTAAPAGEKKGRGGKATSGSKSRGKGSRGEE